MDRSRSSRRALLTLATAIIVSLHAVPGCGSTIDAVQIRPTTEVLRVGGSIRLFAVDGEGRVIDRDLQWSSSNDAIAEIDPAGVAYGVAVGAVDVTVRADGVVSAPYRLEVRPRAVASRIAVTPKVTSVVVGGAKTFTATYTNGEGAVVTDAKFTWTSSNPAVASLAASSEAGGQGIRATALAVGQVDVVASADGISSEPAMLTVVADADAVGTVTVVAPRTGLAVGERIKLTAVAKNVDGREVTGVTFAWKSSDEAFASVDPAGELIGKAPGKTQITATARGVSSPPLTFDVMDRATSRMGKFQGSGSYTVEGTAMLMESAGKLSLSLSSDFFAQSGPDVDVFLSKTDTVGSDSVRVADIHGNGAHTYAVPAGVTLTSHPFVVLQCVKFSVRFGYAKLE